MALDLIPIDGNTHVDQGNYLRHLSKGTVLHSHEPLNPDALPILWKAPTQLAQLAPGFKWCYVCGDVRPKHYFSPDKRSRDGLDARCKQCENERRRKRYQETVGHEPRAYVHREKTAV